MNPTFKSDKPVQTEKIFTSYVEDYDRLIENKEDEIYQTNSQIPRSFEECLNIYKTEVQK